MKALLLLFLFWTTAEAQKLDEPFHPGDTHPTATTVPALRRELTQKYQLNEYQALRLTPAIKQYVNAATADEKAEALRLLNREIHAVTGKEPVE